MLKQREPVINSFLASLEVLIAWVSVSVSLFVHYKHLHFFYDKESIILYLLVGVIWFPLGKYFRLAQLLRSRPYSAILFNCFALVLLGTLLLWGAVQSFKLHYIDISILLYFASVSLGLMFTFKVLLFSYLKGARSKGRNTSSILIIGDKTATMFINQVIQYHEWGYKIMSIVGDSDLQDRFGDVYNVLPEDTDVGKLIEEKTIDEVIFIKDEANMQSVERLTHTCSEVGVVFRM